MRGKRWQCRTPRCKFRITPACAGKTFEDWKPDMQAEDHPRMCGENQSLVPIILSDSGSPPHVRGKHEYANLKAVALGITPACAGKTQISPKYVSASRDHPRMCGENLTISRTRFIAIGSPPHVRGKRACTCRSTMCHGITPACAGKTWKSNRFNQVK